MTRIYACIDLKSFYASVECIERGLNPMTTNLVVADSGRTEKTICLAVSPSLKSFGIGGRARLFEVNQKLKEVNRERRNKTKNYRLTGKSYDYIKLEKDKTLEVDYIIAKPRMAYYIKYSTDIYNIYLKYLSKEDIYVYSIDEVFMDITNYLKYHKMTPKDFITTIIKDVYETLGITATAGIGTNMYLAKVAMDVVAKRTKANNFGVRIASLGEMTYRTLLWNHKPLTDFWRVGKGYAKRLEENNIYTMGDIARCSLEDEDKLYKLFGVNAELLIDHAWGYEPCTIKDVKAYKPTNHTITSGQVLHCPYDYKKARLIIKEMADLLSLDLVSKHLVTDYLTLTIGYDIENITNDNINYTGEIVIDHYGRKVPKSSHGSINIDHKTSSSKVITENMIKLYDKIVSNSLLIRRINISAGTYDEEEASKKKYEQLDIFTNYETYDEDKEKEKENEQEEKRLQNAILGIKNKYGKNAILKGMNLEEGATTIDRNNQIGGHHK